MIVYAVLPDIANKKIFIMPDSYKLQRIRDFNTGEKKGSNWNPPGIEWFSDGRHNFDKYKDPDISYISGPGNLIVNPRTHDLIAHVVNDVAELLPLPFNNEIWYLLNVFNQAGAMDKANSRYKIYRSGKIGWLIAPAFFADKVPHNKLFKIPEDPTTIYFAEPHPDDSENSFKNIVEKNNLFGIEFFNIWEN